MTRRSPARRQPAAAVMLFATAGDDVSATARRVRRRLSAAVAARVSTDVQSSTCRPASRCSPATDDPVNRQGQHDHGTAATAGRDDGSQPRRRRRRAPDAGHSTAAPDAPRLYDDQVQPTHQPGAGETPDTFLPLRRCVNALFVATLLATCNLFSVSQRIRGFAIMRDLHMTFTM